MVAAEAAVVAAAAEEAAVAEAEEAAAAAEAEAVAVAAAAAAAEAEAAEAEVAAEEVAPSGADRERPAGDVAHVGRSVVHHVQRPRPVRIAAVEGRQVDGAARRRRRSRERVAGLVVRRHVVAGACELVAVRKHVRSLVVDRQVAVDDVERATRIGHEDRVLAARCDEQHVDVVRIGVAEAVDLHVDVRDRSAQPGDVAGRRVRCRGARVVDRDPARVGAGRRRRGWRRRRWRRRWRTRRCRAAGRPDPARRRRDHRCRSPGHPTSCSPSRSRCPGSARRRSCSSAPSGPSSPTDPPGSGSGSPAPRPSRCPGRARPVA